MNDPNKRIEVNLSSLLSLKAELLRKHDEVKKARLQNTIENFVPSKGTKPIAKNEPSKDIIAPKKPDKTEPKAEEEEMLKKSKRILEAKSKYYDKLSASGGNLNGDSNCLVMFNHKQQEERLPISQNYYGESSSDSDEYNEADYSSATVDDDWVEYTDCLGRTRKCLKRDLEDFKIRDKKLAEETRTEESEPKWFVDTGGLNENQIDTVSSREESPVPSDHPTLESMKHNWHKQEEYNKEKDNVHYQDVMFDEARTHGVGYYAFSTDHTERVKQQEELDEIRERTLQEQQKREEQRNTRERIIAERVRAAKNRQRARQGLPPLEDEPEPEPVKEPEKTKEEIKREKKEAKQKRRQEKREKQKSMDRQRHVRPWDKGKSGLDSVNTSSSESESEKSEEEWQYKPQKELLTQEEWNEKQRSERKAEFAPIVYPSPSTSIFTGHMFDSRGNFIDHEKEEKSMFFTTKKRKPYHGNEQKTEPVRKRYGGAAIPPPLSLQYQGPPPSKVNIAESIEAGLKYLREQSEKGNV